MTISEIIALPEQRAFEGEFAVSGVKKKLFQAKEGYFLSFDLSDVTGSVNGIIWEGDKFCLEEDTVVFVKGKTATYLGKSQAVVSSAESRETFDKAMFISKSKRDVGEMVSELRGMADNMTDVSIRKLVLSYMDDKDFMAVFSECPGGKGRNIHHAYIGGLLEHTLATMKLARAYAGLYAGVDADMAVAGAFLHDLGKMQSYHYRITIQMTDVGRLHDHPVLGYASFVDRLAGLEIDKAASDRLRLELGHIILSHHGEDSVVKPMTLEAVLVAKADSTDADAASVIGILDRAEDDWSEYDMLRQQFFYRGKEEQVEKPAVPEKPRKNGKIMGKMSGLFNYLI